MLLSARPGHRDEPGAGVAHRWRMLELACAGDPRLVPDDTEIRRAERLGRPSYAVETLEEIRERHPGAVIAWIIGSDAYRELTTWHRWRDMFTLTNLVVLHRPGAPLDLPEELAALTRRRSIDAAPREPAGGVLILDLPMRDISATEIRQRLSGGHGGENHRRIADLLPRAVYTYISEYHLYGVVSDP